MSDVFSPYAIDYSVKNTSKTFGFSKKKITFKFGIANPPAVAAGENGANCRGSEHEIIFTWSLNSGKRQILCDGKDVHYSESGQNGWTADQVFQHHFQIRVTGLAGPLRAHLITQPANRDVPNIKPFDLRINGISYFAMPKIFQLGTPQMIVRPVKGKNNNRNGGNSGNGGNGGNGGHGGNHGHGHGRGGGEDDSHLSPEERQAIAAAKLASMQDLDRGSNVNQMGFASSAHAQGHAQGQAPAPPVVEDLISFDAPAPAAQAHGGYGQPPQQPQYSNYSLGGSVGSAAPPIPQQQSQQFSVQSQGSFASSQPSHQSQFSQPPPPAATAYGQQPQQPPQQQQGSFYGQQQQQPPAQASASASAPPQQQQLQQGSFYGQPPPPPQQQQLQNNSFYGQQPPAALAPAPFDPHQGSLNSPTNTVASYQSYGSAPSFAQPPQQQQQQHQMQQQQQPQQSQQGQFFGQPQGY